MEGRERIFQPLQDMGNLISGRPGSGNKSDEEGDMAVHEQRNFRLGVSLRPIIWRIWSPPLPRVIIAHYSSFINVAGFL
jgi:hypothetical protein